MDDADDGTHVRAPTLDDLARICESLNRSQARYLLIGGFAVIAHGGGRTTKDIDFLIDSSPENVAASKQTLIRTKKTVRPSDQIDREFLAALIREEQDAR